MKAILAKGCAGMTEFELAALVTQEMVAGGSVPRFVSVTSGPRSALADAYPTLRKVREGELVRLDAGCSSTALRPIWPGLSSLENRACWRNVAMMLSPRVGGGTRKDQGRRASGDVYDAAVQTVRRSEYRAIGVTTVGMVSDWGLRSADHRRELRCTSAKWHVPVC